MKRSPEFILGAVLFFALGAAAGGFGPSLWKKNQPIPGFEAKGASERELYQGYYKAYRQKQADIVMLGDSLTCFVNWSELLGRADVAGRGLRFQSAEGLLGLLPDVEALSPRTCFIMIGVNDLLHRSKPVFEVFSSYRKLVTELRAKGIVPVIQSTLPVARSRQDSARVNADIAALNGLLRRLAAQEGIAYLDLVSDLAGDGYLADAFTYDGIHLTGAGYGVWGERVLSFLAAGNRTE
ncbi:MAG TPA: GDSL-type esterase/lipase family protein [Verrucomicrobiae bacterium]|nr:GDSL-type esterase/lipase family protein [Verrucomicrobiae bacterium]